MPLYSDEVDDCEEIVVLDPTSLASTIPILDRSRNLSGTSTATSHSTVASFDSTTKSSFVKVPPEDRSKYEKFVDADDEPAERDSIGSASDLRDSENTQDADEEEGEDDAEELSTIEVRKEIMKTQIISTDTDHLIGHHDGHKPLLDDDDEDDRQGSALSATEPDIFAAAPFKLPLKRGDKDDLYAEYDKPKPVNANLIESTEDEVDEEVARNLLAQVAKDSIPGPEDLFGSKPFGEAQIRAQEQQQLADLFNQDFEPPNSSSFIQALQLDSNLVRLQFPPSSDVMVHNKLPNIHLMSQVPINFAENTQPVRIRPPNFEQFKEPPNPVTISEGFHKSQNSQDLFGSVPFSISNLPISQPVNSVSIPANTSTKLICAATSKPAIPPKSSKVMSSMSSKPAISQRSPSPEKELPIKPLKTKSKSKVLKASKKYEVDEDDDDIDGLISNENDDEEQKPKSKHKDKKSDKKDKSEKKDKNEKKDKQLKEKAKEKVKKKDKTRSGFANMSFEDVHDDVSSSSASGGVKSYHQQATKVGKY